MKTLPQLQIQNSRIVRSDTQEPVQLRGFGLGNWFLIEPFMIGLPSVEQEMRRILRETLGPERSELFWTTYLDNFINEDDFALMASMGVNFVRLAFNYRHFEDDLAPGEWKQDALARFDQIIAWCSKHEIYVLLDLHAAAGCQDHSNNSDNKTAHILMWEDKDYRLRSVRLWRMLAERYSDHTTVMGYDLLNEPCPKDHAILQTFYRECIAAIREVDQNTIIVLEGDLWSKDIESLSEDLFEDPQAMPSTHFYLTYEFPSNEVSAYPSRWKEQDLNREWIRERLMRIADYSHTQRPVLIGEFGPNHSSPDYIWEMYDDAISLFEEYHMPWNFWHYKDIGAMGMLVVKEDTPWQKLVRNPENKAIRKIYRELFNVNFSYGGGPGGSLAKRMVELFPDYDLYEIMGRVRDACRHFDIYPLRKFADRMADEDDAGLVALASSFRLENCEIYKPAETLLKKYLQPSIKAV